MSQIQRLINSPTEEEHSILLVKECSRDWAMSNVLKITDPLGSAEGLFWTITIPPTVLIPDRGKKKEYSKCSVGVQAHFIKHCIINGCWYHFRNSFFVIEHFSSGVCHLHILSSAKGFIQDLKAELMYNFKLDYKKFDDKLNLRHRPIDDIFKAVAYFFKESLTWVSPKDKVCIDDFNESIRLKFYEVSKYNLFYIE